MKYKMKNFIWIIFTSIFLCACSNEPSPGQLLDQGNEAFNQAQYQDAFQTYAEASDLHPDAGEPFYNMGNTLYRQQAYTNTQQLLDQSLARFAGNPAGEPQQQWTQAVHYNLGNTYFSREEWAGAVDAYKEALRLTPDDQEAKYNLELALRRLQEEEEEEQQNQQGGDQDQQNSEDQQDQEQQGGEQQDEPDQQDAPEEQSESDQPQGGEEPEPEQSQEGEGSEDQESGEDQPESEPSSEESSEDASDEGNEDGDASQQQAAQEQQPQDGLTIEQARQLVGTVGENAETLQERLQQIYVAPNPPPEKDW